MYNLTEVPIMMGTQDGTEQGSQCRIECPIIIIAHISKHTRLHGRVGKGVGHLGHDEAMEAGGREFKPRPGHYSRMSF